jgi:hypothetical protein
MLWAAACFFAMAPVAVIDDKPVTVPVAIPEAVRHAKVVMLRIDGVVMRRRGPLVWNVFWDMPGADAHTSVDDVHFAGYVASPANSGVRGEGRPANFILQLPEAAVGAIHQQATMQVTFVPLRKPPEGGVTITALRLE